jgi:hypothetical protein
VPSVTSRATSSACRVAAYATSSSERSASPRTSAAYSSSVGTHVPPLDPYFTPARRFRSMRSPSLLPTSILYFLRAVLLITSQCVTCPETLPARGTRAGSLVCATVCTGSECRVNERAQRSRVARTALSARRRRTRPANHTAKHKTSLPSKLSAVKKSCTRSITKLGNHNMSQSRRWRSTRRTLTSSALGVCDGHIAVMLSQLCPSRISLSFEGGTLPRETALLRSRAPSLHGAPLMTPLSSYVIRDI